MSEPLVSVSIKTYNSGKYIEETIESVMNQTYHNIEIVIGDDGSNDNTPEILMSYKKRFPDKFKIQLNKINRGITANCNSIHNLYEGKYIAHLGGDDIMHDNKILEQVKYMDNHSNCSISYHNMEVFDSETKKILRLRNPTKRNIEGKANVLIKNGPFNGGSSNMVRANKMPKKYDERVPMASDWLYFVQVLLNGGEIHYINSILGKYRRHNNNVTKSGGQFYDQQNLDHLFSCNILLIEQPEYYREITYRYRKLLRWFRSRYPENYEEYLFTSAKIGDFRSKVLLLIYLLSFKKIKL